MSASTPVEFVTRGRSKFSEIDPFGHVNTEHYVSYFLDHRFAGLREVLGLDLRAIAKLPILFVTRRIEVEYAKPLLGDQEFEIRSQVREFGARNCLITMSMKSLAGDEHARCWLELVCLDKRSGSPLEWPAEFVGRFYPKEA